MIYKYIDKVLRTKIMSFFWVVGAHNASPLLKLGFFSRTKGLSLYIYSIRVSVAPWKNFFGLLGVPPGVLLPSWIYDISRNNVKNEKGPWKLLYARMTTSTGCESRVRVYLNLAILPNPGSKFKIFRQSCSKYIGTMCIYWLFFFRNAKRKQMTSFYVVVYHHSHIQAASGKSTDKMAE